MKNKNFKNQRKLIEKYMTSCNEIQKNIYEKKLRKINPYLFCNKLKLD